MTERCPAPRDRRAPPRRGGAGGCRQKFERESPPPLLLEAVAASAVPPPRRFPPLSRTPLGRATRQRDAHRSHLRASVGWGAFDAGQSEKTAVQDESKKKETLCSFRRRRRAPPSRPPLTCLPSLSLSQKKTHDPKQTKTVLLVAFLAVTAALGKDEKKDDKKDDKKE